MPRLRPSLLAFFALGACASAPPRRAGEPWSAPTLELCRGVAVSNAPATDGDARIIAYTPFTAVRDIVIARAPVLGCVSSAFGPRSGGAGAFHEGLDLFTGSARVVVAGGDGRIVSAGGRRGYGLTVEIAHGRGVSTLYAHLSDLAPGLREGAAIAAGASLGRTGRSGNATAIHLHYEVLLDGRPVDPLRAGD
jgi:murein DD-endopeptidase MepM/ murein hydrolase activator NlpD